MPFLVILKRFEVWLLLAVVIALLVFAFRPESGPVPLTDNNAPVTPASVMAAPGEDKGESTAPVPEPPTESFAVDEVNVTPTDGGMIVELTLSGRSLSGEEVTLDESNITATTGEGETVNRFFEPFREPAVLPASGDSLATLKWWLERPADVIWLDLQGQRVKAELR